MRTTKTDLPANLHSLISNFAIRCLDSIIPIHAKAKISRLRLASVAEQVGLSLTWMPTLKTFSCEVAPVSLIN